MPRGLEISQDCARSVRRTSQGPVPGIAIIAHRFGVSYQAAVYRLKSLRYINQAEADQLLGADLAQAGRDYLKALYFFQDLEEPVEEKRGSRELRSRVAHLALEAYRQEEISRGRLLDIGKTISFDGRLLLDLAEAARSE